MSDTDRSHWLLSETSGIEETRNARWQRHLPNDIGLQWLRAGWRDLAVIASPATSKADRAVFTSRMLDRLGLLAPRLAALDQDNELAAADALSDLRLGLNLIEIQRRRQALQGLPRDRVRALLESLARYFRGLRRERIVSPPPAILEAIDDALAAVSAEGSARDKQSMLLTLAGVRRAMFPQAPAYRSPLEREETPPAPAQFAVAAE